MPHTLLASLPSTVTIKMYTLTSPVPEMSELKSNVIGNALDAELDREAMAAGVDTMYRVSPGVNELGMAITSYEAMGEPLGLNETVMTLPVTEVDEIAGEPLGVTLRSCEYGPTWSCVFLMATLTE